MADFVYFDIAKDAQVIEDAKGVQTDMYRLKKHMMKSLLGLDVVESRPRGAGTRSSMPRRRRK